MKVEKKYFSFLWRCIHGWIRTFRQSLWHNHDEQSCTKTEAEKKFSVIWKITSESTLLATATYVNELKWKISSRIIILYEHLFRILKLNSKNYVELKI